MAQLTAYLAFNGNCREAMEFYASATGGTVESMQTFGDAPMPSEPEHANRVMHATVKAGDMTIMASDSMPGQNVTFGDSVTLSVHTATEEEQTTLFNALGEGGTITMPLADAFWGARFGMLTDKFGIHWMFNCEK